MLTVFWNAKGVISIDFLTSGTINAARCCDTLTKLKSAIRRQRKGSSAEGFCSRTIMQDPTQQGTQKNTFVAWDGRDRVTRPTAPNLLHQTFNFFSGIKPELSGRYFRSNDEVRL
ncbi:hypothetical protein AVEN_127765-1 [Araneus ventricosus]|uniref:Uncharacterized protein n=1 Tax=Araneus ventricosus TaxID=182803 RepID=A0A4Y2P377_ARAVE|nr:hypothetical protein AVEN_40886-1 [Araneus ventricosus]GBN45453.1 hypothetical protein AVEN_127765-1 [Araneus ventricosus]